MFTKILSLTLVIIFNCCLLSAQTPKKSVSDETWEYLIVSVGTFSDKEKLTVADKWLGRRQGSIGFYQDTSTQNEFDRLGKLGWELIEILPVTVNDQPAIPNSKFIFKRKFDAARSEREIEDSKQPANKIKSDLPIKVKVENLVELDEAEFTNKQNEVADKAKTRLEQAIKNTGISSIVNLQTRYFKYNKQVSAEVVIDGTSALLKEGNKYRLSEAKKYVRQVATELFNKIGLRQISPNEDFFSENSGFRNTGEVFINLSVVINHNGATRNVTGGYINGSWVETIK